MGECSCFPGGNDPNGEEGELTRKRTVSRHLLTRLGWIRFQRYQIAREGEEEKSIGIFPGLSRARTGIVVVEIDGTILSSQEESGMKVLNKTSLVGPGPSRE